MISEAGGRTWSRGAVDSTVTTLGGAGKALYKGQVLYKGQDIYAPGVDVSQLRREVGMVFQKPNPFPMSIYDNVDGIAAELGEYGADKVYVYNSPLLKDFTTDAYTKVIVEAVEELKPEVLLFGASNIGRDLAPRCAARLHTGLCADCTHLDIDMPNYNYIISATSISLCSF